jgi:polyamine oxidase
MQWAYTYSQPNGPATPVDMVVDYYKYDYEFAEPPRVTSLQNVVPLPTFSDFGDDVYFVADQRGYEAVVYYLAGQFLKADRSGKIVDPRLQLNKVYIYMLAFFFSASCCYIV